MHKYEVKYTVKAYKLSLRLGQKRCSMLKTSIKVKNSVKCLRMCQTGVKASSLSLLGQPEQNKYSDILWNGRKMRSHNVVKLSFQWNL